MFWFSCSKVTRSLAIVALAIIFDRVSQTYGKRLQAYRESGHD